MGAICLLARLCTACYIPAKQIYQVLGDDTGYLVSSSPTESLSGVATPFVRRPFHVIADASVHEHNSRDQRKRHQQADPRMC